MKENCVYLSWHAQPCDRGVRHVLCRPYDLCDLSDESPYVRCPFYLLNPNHREM